MSVRSIEMSVISAAPQQGIKHGPHIPLGEQGLNRLQRWEGEEYDLTDMALQSLHQLYCNRDAAMDARDSRHSSVEDSTFITESNALAAQKILDSALTR